MSNCFLCRLHSLHHPPHLFLIYIIFSGILLSLNSLVQFLFPPLLVLFHLQTVLLLPPINSALPSSLPSPTIPSSSLSPVVSPPANTSHPLVSSDISSQIPITSVFVNLHSLTSSNTHPMLTRSKTSLSSSCLLASTALVEPQTYQ